MCQHGGGWVWEHSWEHVWEPRTRELLGRRWEPESQWSGGAGDRQGEQGLGGHILGFTDKFEGFSFLFKTLQLWEIYP